MVTMTQLEHMVVVGSSAFAGGCTSTRIDTGEGFTQGALELVHELTLGADQPPWLVPNCPPIHVGIVQILFATSCGLLALNTRVSIFTDACSVIPVALSTTSAIKWTASEFTGWSQEWVSVLVVTTCAMSVVLIARTSVQTIIGTCFKLTRGATVWMATTTLTSLNVTGTSAIASVSTLPGVEHTIAVGALFLFTSRTEEFFLTGAAATDGI
jgi:hypothetical protein